MTSSSANKLPLFLVVMGVAVAIGPLVYLPDIEPTLIKFIGGSILLLVALFAWLIGRSSNRALSMRIDIDALLVLGIVILAAISTLTAIDKSVAIIGGYAHYLGLLALTLLAIAFILMKQVQWSQARYRFFLAAAVAGGSVQAVIGLMQLFGGIFGFEVLGVGTSFFRSTGSLGNANIFGSYMVPMVPLALALAGIVNGHVKQAVYALAAIMLVALLSSLSISAWLALFVMGGVALITRWRRRTLDRRVIFVLAGSAVLSAGFLVSSAIGLTKISMLQRLSQAVTVTGSAGSRFQLWKAAVRLILDSPFLGWGPDSFKAAAPGPGLLSGTIELAAHPHNLILELAAGLGLPAAILFLAVIARSLIRFWRLPDTEKSEAWSDDLGQWFGLAIIGQLAVTLTQSLNFLPFLLFITLIAAQSGVAPRRREWEIKIPMVLRVAAAVGVLAVSAVVIWASGRAVGAESLYRLGLGADPMEAPALDSVDRASELNPYFAVYAYRQARIFEARVAGDPDDADYRHGLKVVRAAQVRWPADPTFYMIEARLHETSGEADGVEKAIRAANKALTLHPRSSAVYRILGDLHLLEKDYDRAANNYTHATSGNPASFNLWFRLGAARYKARDRAGALAAYEQADRLRPSTATKVRMGLIKARDYQESGTAQGLARAEETALEVLRWQPDSHIARLIIADSYYARGLYEDAAIHYRKAAELRPGSFYIWYQSGKALQRNGQLEQAVEAYREAVRLKPASPGAMLEIERIQDRLESEAYERGF